MPKKIKQMQTGNNKRKTLTVVLAAGFVLLSIAALVSVKLIANYNASPTSVQADSNFTPNVNQGFSDNFADGKINEAKWNDYKNVQGVIVTETTKDNLLNINIPEGSVSGKAKNGGLVFKSPIKADSDFRVVASIYKPIVKGNGPAITGITFTSSDTNQDEAVRVFWRVDGNVSELVMTVMAADGKIIESNKVPVEAAKVSLRLVRVDKTYTAHYSIGLDDDRKFIKIGQAENLSLGAAGKIRLFANNVGKDKKFPRITSRIDGVTIAWYDSSAPEREFMGDRFNGASIDTSKWAVSTQSGTTATQSATDNLVLNITAGANGNKPKVVSLLTKTSIDQKKNFWATTSMFKPIVTGEGTGRSGFQFLTNGANNDEAGTIAWIVSGSSSKLVFTVQAANGKVLAKEEVDLAAADNKVILRISRNQEGYIGLYKIGASDSDTAWKKFSSRVVISNTGEGRFRLFASNGGTVGKYPAVKARFDAFSVGYLE